MSHNPFDAGDANPFEDESISEALAGNAAPMGYSVPTEHVLDVPTAPSSSSQQPANRPLAASGPGSIDWAKKEADLRRREEALAAREQGVLQQEAQLRASGLHPPNWPPFYPFIYHDIDAQVPAASRPLTHKIYKYWLASIAVLLANTVACLAILASHSTSTGGTDFGGSLIYAFSITALSFFSWYRPVYNAFAKDSSLFFYIFLLFEGFHVLFASYMAVGLPGSGSGGLINLLSVLTDGKIISAVFCAIATSGWIADALFGFWIWVEVNGHVKRGGHSLDTARTQAMQMGVLGTAI